MSLARQLADLLEDDGDIKAANLDNAPQQTADWNTMTNKPTLASSATTSTSNASNISSGRIPGARLGGGSAHSGTYLRGDMNWVNNCSNWPNCTTNHCNCACQCNC